MIRNLKDIDVPKLMKLESETCFMNWNQDHFQSFLSPRTANLYRFAKVWDEGGVKGFCLAAAVAGEVELQLLAVQENFRRKGIAHCLVSELMHWARGMSAENIFLEVRESNLGAITFYQQLGFQSNGKRLGYFKNPKENALNLLFLLN